MIKYNYLYITKIYTGLIYFPKRKFSARQTINLSYSILGHDMQYMYMIQTVPTTLCDCMRQLNHIGSVIKDAPPHLHSFTTDVCSFIFSVRL